MTTIQLELWVIQLIFSSTGLSVSLTHQDGSAIHDTGADIGSEEELGYRFTTNAIEARYDQHGELNGPYHHPITVCSQDFEITLLVDEDAHLNVYLKKDEPVVMDAIEDDALTVTLRAH